MRKLLVGLILSIITLFAFSGCTVKLAPEQQIPQAKKVEKVNHELSKEKQREIQKKYFEYQASLVTGVVSLAFNAAKKSEYYKDLENKNVDMSHEKMYDCKISQLFGNFPEEYFHNMFVVSNKRIAHKPVSVALNMNDVNEFKVYKNDIYDHKDGGYGIAITDPNSDLDNLTGIRYKCTKVKNFIFKPDNYKPVYNTNE